MGWRAAIGVLGAIALAVVLLFGRTGSDDAEPVGSEPVGSDPTTAAEPETARAPEAAEPASSLLRGADGATPPRAAEPAPTAPPGSRTVRIRGKVVDASRKPVPQADVAVLAAGASLGVTRSGGDGSFSLDVSVPPGPRGLLGQVRAREGARVGYGQVVLRMDRRWSPFAEPPADDLDVGSIHLATAVSLEVAVATSCSPASPVRVTASTLGFGRGAASGTATAGADGRCRIDDLLPGTYRVVASAAGCGRGVVVTAVPREGGEPVRVELGAERVVEVEVVEAKTEAPVEGAVVSVTETFSIGSRAVSSAAIEPSPPIAVTDARGRTKVMGLGAADILSFNAEAPGFGAQNAAEGERGTGLRSGDSVRITLHRRRRVEFPVVAGERPVPPDGTVVRLTPSPGSGFLDLPKEARIEGTRLVGDDFPPGWVHALAVAPDGSIAALFAAQDKEVGHETSFRAPRAIDVTLRYVDGAPATGFWIAARNQGNNPMGPPAPTDASGKARLEGLHGQLVEVYASETRSSWGGIPIGSVDLEKGGGALEGTLERERRYLLTVRVDGEPRLPATTGVRVGFGGVNVDEQDADRGTIRFRWRPPAKRETRPTVTVEAPGFLPSSSPLPDVDASTEGAVAVDLLPAASVVLRVTAAPGTHYRVESQRWDESTQEWVAGGHDSAVFGGGELRIDATGVGRIESLAPGRYRFVDRTSGASSSTVEARAGAGPVEARLDLSASGWVRGKVVVPEGESVREARVRRVGGARSLSPFPSEDSSGFVAEDGSFSVRVPGDVPVTLEVSHPLLSAADPGGRVVVTKPVDDVVLRLVAGARAVLRLDKPLRARSGVPVLLFRGEPEGTPVARLAANVDDTTVRFGGFEPGTYTVWIDAQPFAPAVVRDAALGTGETDLGTVALTEGRRIVLKVLVKDGQATPRTSLWARREGEPTYARVGNFAEGNGVLTGLGPGVFRAGGGAIMQAGGEHLDETVDLTTATEATLTLDLR